MTNMPCPTKGCPICKPYKENTSFDEVFMHLNMNGKHLDSERTISIGAGGRMVSVEDKKPKYTWVSCFMFKTKEEAEKMYDKLQKENKE